MGATLERNHVSEPEYLAAEELAAMRSEYVAGEVFAMAGGSERHNRISLNIAFHLRAASRGHRCRAFMADMKLRVAAQHAFYYPDAMFVCDDTDDHSQYKERPCFIAEVLSPGTASIDAREKWLHYRELPSLRYYLMVDSERVWARLRSRADEGRWLEQQLDAGDVARIECGGLVIALSLEDLYEDTGLAIT
jgi:Uma2 family endonuclease